MDRREASSEIVETPIAAPRPDRAAVRTGQAPLAGGSRRGHLRLASDPQSAAERLRPHIPPRTAKRWLIFADVVAVLAGIGFAFFVEAVWWSVESDILFGQWLVVVASAPL